MFGAAPAQTSAATRLGTNSADQTSQSEKQLQQNALNELVGLLLSAGYFRARVSTLTPFDKVVGGMCWSITSSGAAVDVDILYKEDLNLGQKIQLSENIIKVLRSMRCPSPLQANQIQGSDFVAIYPVIQWLVKLVLENRAATGDSIRAVSESIFGRLYRPVVRSIASSSSAAPKDDTITTPKRQFRRPASLWRKNLSDDAMVATCLMEYGERVAGVARVDEGDEDGEEGKSGSDGSGKRRGDHGGADGGGAGGSGGSGSGSGSGSAAGAGGAGGDDELESIDPASRGARVVGVDSDAIKRSADEYRAREEEIRAAAESGDLVHGTKLGKAQARRRAINTARRRVASARSSKTVAEEEHAGVLAEYQALQAALDKATAYNDRVRAATAKLDEASSKPEHQSDLARLRELVALNEGLKLQETQFKASCARQLGILKAKLEAAQGTDGATAEESARLTEIERVHDQVTSKHYRLRTLLARKNQDMARLRRLIDDIPTRSELIQYERRFVELFDQVADKLDETRKYFSTYNSLYSKKTYLAKEESVITQLHQNFATSMRSKAGKTQYLQQCDIVINDLRNSEGQQRSHLGDKTSHRDVSAAEYQKLLDAQRAYYRKVKMFQDMCDESEELSASITALGATPGSS